jgi:signal transduction histidine kinase
VVLTGHDAEAVWPADRRLRVDPAQDPLRDRTRLSVLADLSLLLAAIHDLDEVVKRVCDAATALTQAELGFYVTWDDGEPKHALTGATFEESASGSERITSYLAVPVRGRRGDVIGAIALASSRAGAFDARAEQLVAGRASLTATATESARLFRQAHELIAALEKSNHDLDQFAYVTSHDQRAPLRGIANLGTWIEEELGDRHPSAAAAGVHEPHQQRSQARHG